MTTATSDVIEQDFTVGAQGALEVSNVLGSVTVRARDGESIHLRARKHGSEEAMENTEIDVRQEGNRVTVTTRAREHPDHANLAGKMSNVQYDIEVPRHCDVAVRTVNGEIRVEGTQGPLRAEAKNGAVTLKDVGASCQVRTGNGALRGERITGTIDFHGTNGQADVVASRLGGFDFHGTNGDIRVETSLSAGGRYLAEATNGSVRLLVPADTAATVEMQTVNGTITCDLPAEVTSAGKRHWSGRINGGGAAVHLKTVNGSARLGYGSSAQSPEGEHSSGHLQDPPGGDRPPEGDAPPPEQSVDQETTTELLRALAEGKISVDDALTQLDEME